MYGPTAPSHPSVPHAIMVLLVVLLFVACENEKPVPTPTPTPTPIPPIAAKNILVNWERAELEGKPSEFSGFYRGFGVLWSLKQTRITFVDKEGDVALVPDYGSIWRTENGGKSWQKVSTLLCQTPIVKDPRNPEVMYVGTRNDATVYRSTDGGNTWEGLAVTGLGRTREDLFQGVQELVIDSKSRIWILLDSGIFKSEDGGEHWSSFEELYPFVWKYAPETDAEGKAEMRVYASADNGQSWEDIGRADMEHIQEAQYGYQGPFNVDNIIGDPDSEVIYVYGHTMTEPDGRYLLKTAGGGSSWEGFRDNTLGWQLNSDPDNYQKSDAALAGC